MVRDRFTAVDLIQVLSTRAECNLLFFFFAGKEQREKSEFVEVPRNLKRYVIGTGGVVIKEISQKSGARVTSQSMEEEGFTISGSQKQRIWARRLIIEKVVSL